MTPNRPCASCGKEWAPFGYRLAHSKAIDGHVWACLACKPRADSWYRDLKKPAADKPPEQLGLL